MPKFCPRQLESKTDFLCPFKTKIPFFQKFGVSLGYVFRRVARPEMAEYFRAFSLLQVRDAKAAKDVEAAALVRHVVENRMQAVAQGVRLPKLGASRRMKQKSRFAFAHIVPLENLEISERMGVMFPL